MAMETHFTELANFSGPTNCIIVSGKSVYISQNLENLNHPIKIDLFYYV